jgi:hypothetical protein
MPRYDTRCSACGNESTQFTSISRIGDLVCESCESPVEIMIGEPTYGQPKHQTHAVLSNGQKVAGQFGRAAQTNKGRSR